MFVLHLLYMLMNAIALRSAFKSEYIFSTILSVSISQVIACSLRTEEKSFSLHHLRISFHQILCFLYYVVSRFLRTTDQNKQSKTISDFLILSLSQQKYLIPAPQKSLEEISHRHFISSRFFCFLILSQLSLIRQLIQLCIQLHSDLFCLWFAYLCCIILYSGRFFGMLFHKIPSK